MVFSLPCQITLRREKQDNQTRASSNPFVNLSLDWTYRLRGQEGWVRLNFPTRIPGRFRALGRLREGQPKRRTPRRLFGGKGALHDAFSVEKAHSATPFRRKRRRGRRLLFFCFVGNAGSAFALPGKELRAWGGRCGSPGEAVGGRRSDAADLPVWTCLLGSRGISRAPA